MSGNKYRLKEADIKDLVPAMGNCIASDKITIEGEKIGYMYRDIPEDKDDSGWRFLSGTEDQEYADDPHNSMVFDVNTIANYDPAIIPYLKRKKGTEWERIEGTDEFREI
ncbi:MAG: DUF2185 domain-containing protein [Bacteroidales bacterium]